MSSERSSRDFLAARDARHAWTLEACRLAGETGHGAVLFLSTNLPGPDKDRPELEALLERALAGLAAGEVDATPLRAGSDLLGPYRILLAREAAARVKVAAVALEGRLPGGRLLDLDVVAPDGRPVDRHSLGLAPRSCYACDRPARECILLARHPLAELLAAVDAHLVPAGSG
jgi:holo-ACP synthase CitX